MDNSQNSDVHKIKLVVIGSSNVGKTSLIIRFTQDEFNPVSQPTPGAAFNCKNMEIELDNLEKKSVSFQIWDTAGQEKYRSLAPMYYRDASSAIIVYDCTNRQAFDDVKYWVKDVKEKATPGVHITIVSNKSDLYEECQVETSVGEKYAREIGANFVETSAKLGIGVEKLFNEIGQRCFIKPEAKDKERAKSFGLVKEDSNEKSGRCCSK